MSHSMQLQGLKQNLALSDLPSSSRANGPEQNRPGFRKGTKDLNEYAAASDAESKDLEQLREQLQGKELSEDPQPMNLKQLTRNMNVDSNPITQF
jgi:hypothetical protein